MTGRTDPRVVAICGSVRENSRTRIALTQALNAAESAGTMAELVDLRNYELPSLNAVDTAVPDAEELRGTVASAEGVLLGTPNYHGSYSGALKNALDYCGREEFEDTTVGLLEVAAGAFPGSALIHLRTVSRTLRAWTLPTEVAIPDSHAVIGNDRINDAEIAERTARLGRELAEHAGGATPPERFPREPTAADDEAED